MRYRDAVSEARQLRKRSEADQWRLAELTWEQTQAGVTLRQWAEDVGVSHVYVSKLAKVWEAHGGNVVNSRPAFCDAYAEAQGLPLERSDRRIREAAATLRKASLADKAALIEEVLATPEGADVMEQVLDKSVKASANISRGSQRVQDKREKQASDRQRDKNPDLHRLGFYLEAGRLIAHARRDLDLAADQIKGGAPFTADQMASLQEDAQATAQRLGWVESMLRQADQSLDDQLQKLLREG